MNETSSATYESGLIHFIWLTRIPGVEPLSSFIFFKRAKHSCGVHVILISGRIVCEVIYSYQRHMPSLIMLAKSSTVPCRIISHLSKSNCSPKNAWRGCFRSSVLFACSNCAWLIQAISSFISVLSSIHMRLPFTSFPLQRHRLRSHTSQPVLCVEICFLFLLVAWHCTHVSRLRRHLP